MAVPWVRFTENALVPKIMLQFQNGDTFQHQGDSAGIFMYSAGIFETFVKKILCPRASPMCTGYVYGIAVKIFSIKSSHVAVKFCLMLQILKRP